jgi:hypothetical protein
VLRHIHNPRRQAENAQTRKEEKMAKTIQQGGERSKVRIFFVEGDFAPGDLHELTQALTTAIRPAPAFTRTALPVRAALAPSPAGEVTDSETDIDDPLVEGEVSGGDSSSGFSVPKRPAKPRKYRSPEAVDIDLGAGEKPWKQFAAEKAPDSHRARYLVAAAWLLDNLKLKDITSDHVFTCYKGAGWNFDIQDPGVTFRQIKLERLGQVTSGKFTINHLGLAAVNDMNAVR